MKEIIELLKEYEFTKQVNSLTTLDLHGTHIEDKHVEEIGEALKVNSTLTSLNLSDNNITDIGAAKIGEVLKHNSTLTSITLMNTKIEDAAEIVKELKFNHTLTSLFIYRIEYEYDYTPGSKHDNSSMIEPKGIKKVNKYLKRNKDFKSSSMNQAEKTKNTKDEEIKKDLNKEAFEKGIEQGIQKGELKGEIKGEIKQVKTMFELNISPELFIPKLKFLTQESIKDQLDNNLNYIKEHFTYSEDQICSDLNLLGDFI